MKIRGNKKWLLLAVATVLVGCGSSSSSSGDYIGSGGTGIISTAGSPAEMSVGDLIAYDLGGGEVTIDFADVNANAEFIMVTGTYDPSIGSSIKLASDIVDLAVVDKSIAGFEGVADTEAELSGEYGAQEILASWLRAAEQEMALDMPATDLNGRTIGELSKSVGVGSSNSFRVLESTGNTNSYKTVAAMAECVRDNIILFVDTRVGIDVLDDAEIDEACEALDDLVGDVTDLLGDTSDVNGDGRLSVLITPQVNLLGGSMGGIIVGYFFGADLYNRTNSNPVSNEQEIVYVIAPDPTGEYGPRISKSWFHDELLRAVVPHELQHAISYNQHVFENGGSSEESWLNEGMSHLIEDLVGYGNGNPARYGMFLANPAITPLVKTSSPNLRERGAAYLFMRYLYEQSDDGDAFLRRLIDTNLTGIENVVIAFAGSDENFDQFSELLAHWAVSLAMSGREINDNPRFNYRERTRDAQSDNWKGALISRRADNSAGTLSGGVRLESLPTNIDQTLESSSASYFKIESVPSWTTLEARGDRDYAVLIRTE